MNRVRHLLGILRRSRIAVPGALAVAGIAALVSLSASAGSSAKTAVGRAAGRPMLIRRPVVRGRAVVGATLTSTIGRWSGAPMTMRREWMRCDVRLRHCVDEQWAGATYRIRRFDLAKRIVLNVTSANLAARRSATSLPTVVVSARPSTRHGRPRTIADSARFEHGDWREWSQLSTRDGSGSVITRPVYEGSRAGRLTVHGGGGNKYGRAYFNISNWRAGSDHWFGGAFYLPPGSIRAIQGDIAIMRWDDWALARSTQDQFGVWLHGLGADRGAPYLMFNNERTGEHDVLVDSGAPLSDGGWHCVEVRDKLGSDGRAISQLWLDGRRLGASSAHNMLGGRVPQSLGYGIVAINGGAQTKPLSIDIDNAYTATIRTGCR